jgi:hypothetical protein
MLNDVSYVTKYYKNFNYVRVDLSVQDFYIIIQYDGFNIKSFAFCDPILKIHKNLILNESHIWVFCDDNGKTLICRKSKINLMEFVIDYINTHVGKYHNYIRSNPGCIRNLNISYRMPDNDIHDDQVINLL